MSRWVLRRFHEGIKKIEEYVVGLTFSQEGLLTPPSRQRGGGGMEDNVPCKIKPSLTLHSQTTGPGTLVGHTDDGTRLSRHKKTTGN